MHAMALCWTGLALALWSRGGSATPFPFQILTEGSATEEETGTSAPGPSPPPGYHTTPPGGQTDGEATALQQLVEFLHSNLLFILIGASVVLVLLLLVCSVVLLKRKWRINAYYPCSFPSKMYVEQRDKVGGVTRFGQVPQKAPEGPEREPVDSGQQLQQDIMRAAKGLRTPSKQPPPDTDANPSPKTADGGLLLDKEPANPPEEDETSRPSETEASDEETRERELPLISPEQTGQEESEEPLRSVADPSAVQPDHRPTSQLIQCDSPTPQLITGEKTAF